MVSVSWLAHLLAMGIEIIGTLRPLFYRGRGRQSHRQHHLRPRSHRIRNSSN
jgi:hypothetical protein